VNIADDTLSLKHSLLVAQRDTKDIVNTDTPYNSTLSDLILRLRKEYGFNSKGHPYNQQDYTVMSDSKPNTEAFKRVIALYPFEEVVKATASYYTKNKACKTFMRFFEEKLIDEVIADSESTYIPDNAI
jgi:nucleoside-diphosphate-sugar epimerase